MSQLEAQSRTNLFNEMATSGNSCRIWRSTVNNRTPFACASATNSTVISGAFRSRNELKDRRGRNRELLSIQHVLDEIRDGACLFSGYWAPSHRSGQRVPELRTPQNRHDPIGVLRPSRVGGRRMRRRHVAVTDDICVDANYICARVLQSTFAFPPIDLSCRDRAAKQRPDPTNGFFQLCRVKWEGSAGRAF